MSDNPERPPLPKLDTVPDQYGPDQYGPDHNGAKTPAGRLVIFDCDGVLVDSEALVSELEAELLAGVGVPLTADQISEQFVGLSEKEMTLRIRQQWGVVLDEAFISEKNRRIAHMIATELEPVKGMSELLATIDDGLCVASSSSPERIRSSLERTQLAHFFGPFVFSASMVQHGKPAPDLFLYAANTMQTSPGNCVVVEDSPFGVAAGVAAGMRVIGFTGASHCGPLVGDRLRRAGAAEVAANAAELAPLLGPG